MIKETGSGHRAQVSTPRTRQISAKKRKSGNRGGLEVQATPDRNHHEDSPANDVGQGNGNGNVNGTTQQQTPQNNVPTSESAVHHTGEPTEESRNVGRTRWTNEMNAFLYRSYLMLTKMETSTEPYGDRLLRLTTDRFPELRSKTAQNIVAQKRQILTQNRLPQEQMISIRKEVQEALGIVDERIDELNTLLHETEVGAEGNSESNNADNDINQDLQKNLLLYSGTDPTKRPKIQKLKANRKTEQTIHRVNTAVSQIMQTCENLEELQTIVYCAAKTTTDLHEKTRPTEMVRQSGKKSTPPWERRLTTKVEMLRTQIARLTQAAQGRTTKQSTRAKVEQIMKTYNDRENTTIEEITDLLKQKLAVLSNRIRRYRESQRRRQQNMQFNNNQRNFYRQIERNSEIQNPETPDQQGTKQYWEAIWQDPVTHNGNSKWIRTEKNRSNKINVMTPIQITTDDIKKATQKTLNWRAPGIDGIHNFWYKKLTSIHEKTADLFNQCLKEPSKIPPFMTIGVTYLLPKTTPASRDPALYRPITCLPTIYKLLTSILTDKISDHLDTNNIIAEEQKGSKRNSRGCKEQIIIDSAIVGEAKKLKKPLYTAYIDYKKAFDKIPHSWLMETLGLYKINPQIIQLLQHMMAKWQTKLTMSNKNETTEIGNVQIQRGIFQGDSLSALWFCLAINPLSAILNKDKRGYNIGAKPETITHLLYMDDLKIYATNRNDLQKLLKSIEMFSNDIRMEMGMDKCRINAMEKGKWVEDEGYRMVSDAPQHIRGMGPEETYKYLGFEQSRGISIKKIKQNLLEETKRRIELLLKTKLSGQNMVTAINSYALPVLMYSFGVIRWTQTELDDLNRRVRVLFTKHRAHHPRSSVERFHLPRKKGGRGITDMKNLYYDQIENLRNFFIHKSETSRIHRAISEIDNKITPLHLKNDSLETKERTTDINTKIQQWKAKELHGRYIHMIESEHIDTEASMGWMCGSNVFVETEGFMVAIQDQVIPTLTYKKYIMKENITNTACRICEQKQETIEHILSGCSVLAPKEYTRRHNNVAKIIHQNILRYYDSNTQMTPYYKYEPPAIVDTPTAKVYWNRTIQTDRTVQHNRPDITVIDKQTNTTYLIDISIPSPANIQLKHRDKIEKYIPLAQDVKEVWQQQAVIIVPLILGATGEIPKKLHEGLKILNLPTMLYKQLQKVVILESSSIMRQVLTQNT